MHPAIVTPHSWSLAPFILLLAALALGPALARDWWSRHYTLVALSLGAVAGGYYLFSLQAAAKIGQTVHEYLSFVTLVGSLFVVAGGIHIRVGGRAGPGRNTVFLLAGAVLANVLGTTGAAMLLIRPWLRFNEARIQAHHLVFFIFLVANVGGGLTPIGDPPLFLGYLQGVPFWWVARHCWPIWAVAVGWLLAVFYLLDKQHHSRAVEPGTGAEIPTHWGLAGGGNLFFLAVILGAVFVDHPVYLREGMMAAAAAGSFFTTPRSVHKANGFNFHPLIEVAVVFAGIFATMMPALDWLRAAAAHWPAPTPGRLYWGTGLLSSLLDNAPTYLAFFNILAGGAGGADTATWLAGQAAGVAAISMGAVCFGAATYIGNGPNFMVKALAEERKIPMPSMLGYVGGYALPWLLPMLGIVWLVFFRA